MKKTSASVRRLSGEHPPRLRRIERLTLVKKPGGFPDLFSEPKHLTGQLDRYIDAMITSSLLKFQAELGLQGSVHCTRPEGAYRSLSSNDFHNLMMLEPAESLRDERIFSTAIFQHRRKIVVQSFDSLFRVSVRNDRNRFAEGFKNPQYKIEKMYRFL